MPHAATAVFQRNFIKLGRDPIGHDISCPYKAFSICVTTPRCKYLQRIYLPIMALQVLAGRISMFKKVLIANRGEIAVRIIRACQEMNILTVAVHSTADADSLAVQLADQSVCIGPPAAKESYLSIANIVSAAAITGAEAIHPGYGFLAENASFANICAQVGIAFIGPTPRAIDTMGNKAAAREAMQKAGVPIVPGTPRRDCG